MATTSGKTAHNCRVTTVLTRDRVSSLTTTVTTTLQRRLRRLMGTVKSRTWCRHRRMYRHRRRQFSQSVLQLTSRWTNQQVSSSRGQTNQMLMWVYSQLARKLVNFDRANQPRERVREGRWQRQQRRSAFRRRRLLFLLAMHLPHLRPILRF